MDGLKKEVQLRTLELDRLEQSSRRESIRICGIDETAGEDTDVLVRELVADIGMTLTPEDISVSYRLPGRSGITRLIIVKFVWRNTKTAMMKSKRKLHDANRKGVYINGDVTPLVCDANRKGVYINDDLRPLHAKTARILRE